ncbi:MAG TPA: DivIVA domain-containing protein, partial [Acidimicrobiales bacterium]|nr:DivIVA domain-containing protein [Acidimicrobiales bacterium]
DAEALQEQVRQAGDRLKQAAERIAQLEGMLQEAQVQPQVGAPVSDDTLQRTLLLAQKFVDQTQAEAESQARLLVADAEERARRVIGEAEVRAKSVTEDTERHLREEISRLESIRTQLAGDVETISRHMENERNRLRGALSDMLSWVDEHVQPAGSLLAQRSVPRPTPRPDDAPMSSPRPADEIPTVAAPDPVGGPGDAISVQGNAATGGARAVDSEGGAAESDQGVMPMEDSAQPQAIAPR